MESKQTEKTVPLSCPCENLFETHKRTDAYFGLQISKDQILKLCYMGVITKAKIGISGIS